MTSTVDDEAPARLPSRRRGGLVVGVVGALGVGVWSVAVMLHRSGGDEGVLSVRQCRGLTAADCLSQAEGWLLDRSRALSTGSTTSTGDFDHALNGAMTGFAEIRAFHAESVYGQGEGKPATALHVSLTLRTEQGGTSVTRTFCPGSSPRLLPGKVDCS